MKHDRVRKFLADIVVPTKCITCRGDAALLADIAQFAAMRAAGKTKVPWMYFHKHCLAANGYRPTYAALMNHVRRCLGGKGL